MTLHLHVFLWLKMVCILFIPCWYSYNLWTLIIATPFFLTNWRMRYSRMTWHLLILAKCLRIILQNKSQNSMFLEWHTNTYQGHICSYMTETFPMCLLLCVEFGQILWPLLRDVSCSQDQNATYNSCSYTGNTLKHVFITIT